MLITACSCSRSSPEVVRHTNNELFGVACASTSRCVAVGNSGNPSGSEGSRTLILESTGDAWSIVPSPHPSVAQSSLLRDVTCAGTTRCVAVGSYKVEYVSKTLIEENTGSGWNIVSSPNPTDDDNSSLSGVTCVTASHCIAVGGYVAGDGAGKTLIEEDTGSGWTIVPTTNISSHNYFEKVACAGAARCIAVGSALNPVIGENSGKGWTGVPFQGTFGLDDVSCGSPTHCVIVGSSGSSFGGDEHPVILETGASGWVITASARPDGGLIGVTCTSATQCIAVGTVGGGESVIEQRTGTGWILLPRLTLITIEPSYLATVDLESVACAGAERCVLVGAQYIGAYANGTGNGKTLIAENTGSGWAVVSTPNVGPP
jgi:hypothetical protein